MSLPLSRKRNRNTNEDEASEFTPLSKRINNLHLNATFSLPKPLAECGPKLEAHKDLVATNERLTSLQYNVARGIDDTSLTSPQSVQWPTYSPDLTPSENPFYYEPNRLLFELYQQRVQRQPSGSHF